MRTNPGDSVNTRVRSFCIIIPLALSALGACTDAGSGDDPLAQDTTLTRDLALANQDTASQPQLKDVPAAAEPTIVEPEVERAPAPPVARPRTQPPRRVAVTPRPAPRPVRTRPAPRTEPEAERETPAVTESGNTVTVGARGSERAVGVVSVGSELALTAGQRICTNTNSVGDRFTARLAEPVMGANGAVIPVGASALVEISSLKKSKRDGDEIEVGLRVESITFNGRTYPVTSEVTYAQVDKVRAESRGDDVRKVATGAAIGAVLGQIFGGKTKSTVIGAAGGAAAGAVIASRNADFDGCLPSGGKITVRLTQPLTIQISE